MSGFVYVVDNDLSFRTAIQRRLQLAATKSAARKREQKKRWSRHGQKRRTGCEGRISVARRRHGLDPCHYKGSTGMKKRWLGLGVIADNLMSIGRVMEDSHPQR